MRILHVSEVSWGGVVSLLREFCAEQVDRGHDVHVLAPPAFPVLAGVRHHRWNLDRHRPTTFAHSLVRYRNTLRTVSPDVAHLHSFLAGFFGRIPLVSGRVPVVYQPHAWSFQVYDDRFGRVIAGWERFADRRTDMLVANCVDEIDEGRRTGVTTPALPLGVAVDAAAYRPVEDEDRQDLRRDIGLTTSRMLLCLGRLARQKGQDQLVEAWERRPEPDTTLVLAGPGDWESLRPLAPTQWNRTVRCFPEQSDVRPWLWACDLLLLPSRYETVAVVVAEAMACGRPAVAVQVSGVAEALLAGQHPPAGAVVPLGDMDRLLEEAARRLHDAPLLIREGLAARARAEDLFTVSVVADRLDAAYVRARQNQGRVA